MRLLVTGGTGHLGRAVVPAAQRAGHEVGILSRQRQAASSGVAWATGDLATGAGLREAVDGVDAIIHAASDLRNSAADDEPSAWRMRRLAKAENPLGILLGVCGGRAAG